MTDNLQLDVSMIENPEAVRRIKQLRIPKASLIDRLYLVTLSRQKPLESWKTKQKV